VVMISSEARSRIEKYGKVTREIRQKGIPFNVSLFVPIANPFVEKQMLFKAQYRLTGIGLEDVREGLMFGDFTGFMDMKLDEFSRKKRTRHFKINPFTKKLEEVWGSKFGRAGIRAGHAVAAAMVKMLGLVEWHMSEEPGDNPDLVSIRVKVTSRFFGGVFMFRVHRQPDSVIVDDDWLPEGGGNVRTPALPMANLVLQTHPLGFEQIVERITEEILQAKKKGRPYVGQIGLPSIEIA
jgi:hypothetical protein